jgi:hypothetical protein
LLFQRLVVDVELGPEGRLQPRAGAVWRPEPARRESSIHRRFVALAAAPDAQIVAFASIYGFLRRQGGGVLGTPGPASAALTAAVGQEAADDSIRVDDWLRGGAIGDPPEGTADTIGFLALWASLPAAMLDAVDAYLDGTATPAPIALTDFVSIAVTSALAAGVPGNPYLVDPRQIRVIDPGRLRRALRVNEWVSRVIGGLEDVPESLAVFGGPDALLRLLATNAPEAMSAPELLDGPDGPVTAYMRSLATETVDDWRAAARDIGTRVRALDLIRRALRPQGITRADKRELADLYADLAAYRSPLSLSAAEIADRVRPLLASSIEVELAALGAWPMPRAGLAGLYVRVLVASWRELAGRSPDLACATPGCAGTVPMTRNRRFCEACRVDRRRDSVRWSRSRVVSARGSG